MPTAKQVKPCKMPCPKCGGLDIGRHFRAKGEKFDTLVGEDPRKTKFLRIVEFNDQQAIVDCIAHNCRTCQYRWETPPLPSKDEPEEPKE